MNGFASLAVGFADLELLDYQLTAEHPCDTIVTLFPCRNQADCQSTCISQHGHGCDMTCLSTIGNLCVCGDLPIPP